MSMRSAKRARCDQLPKVEIGCVLKVSAAFPFAGKARLGEENVSFSDTGANRFQAPLASGTVGVTILFFDTEIRDRNMQSVFCPCNFFCAVIWEGDKRPKFIRRAYVKLVELIRVHLEFIGRGVDLQCCLGPLQDSVDRVASDSDPERKSGCSQGRFEAFSASLSSAVSERDVQSNDYRAACADRSCDVPEVFGRSAGARRDHPNSVESKKGNTDHERCKGKFDDFPRAFHDFPGFDLGRS